MDFMRGHATQGPFISGALSSPTSNQVYFSLLFKHAMPCYSVSLAVHGFKYKSKAIIVGTQLKHHNSSSRFRLRLRRRRSLFCGRLFRCGRFSFYGGVGFLLKFVK